ncbi:MAG: hypothetical protein ABIW84_09155 [Ilumatobacteraceae bacterium]
MIRNGVIAGVVGTLAMDLVWFARDRAKGGQQAFTSFEFGSSATGFEEAPAPARVGRYVARLAHVELPDRLAGQTNNVVHWATGITWGVFAAGLRSVPRVGPVRAGFIAALSAFATSYVVLPKIGVYEPITDYDSKTLWDDLSAHLVFGAALGTSIGLLHD